VADLPFGTLVEGVVGKDEAGWYVLDPSHGKCYLEEALQKVEGKEARIVINEIADLRKIEEMLLEQGIDPSQLVVQVPQD
jgi:hypothetical protein